MTAPSSNCHRQFIRMREDRVVRVLIVEDELRMASLIRRGLVNEGLAADVAGSGEDALWMAPAHDYDAVVLDVMLPDLDGFEVCRRLQHGRPDARSAKPPTDVEAVEIGQHHGETTDSAASRGGRPEMDPSTA